MSDAMKSEMKSLSTSGGRYIMLEQIGKGGMGQVWSATRVDGKLYKSCAIKILHSALALTEDACERFLNEARISAQLDHSRIVRVTDMGMLGDAPFLVMDRVDGVDLRKFQTGAGERLGLDIALYIIGEVLAALEYAHDRTIGGVDAGVVHSDVTPGNILISSSGDIRLTDFGIARFAHMDGTMTRPIGTPRYMSPEQRTGKTPRQTDIFSLGVIFHELLEGARYFGEYNDNEFTQLVLNGHIPNLSQPDIPEWVDTLRRQMLADRISDRPRATDARAIILKKSPQYLLASKRLEGLYKKLFGEKRSGLTKVFNTEDFFGRAPEPAPGPAPGPALGRAPELAESVAPPLQLESGSSAPATLPETNSATDRGRDSAPALLSAWVTSDRTATVLPPLHGAQAKLPSMLAAPVEPPEHSVEVEPTAVLESPFSETAEGVPERHPSKTRPQRFARPPAESAPVLHGEPSGAAGSAQPRRSAEFWIVSIIGGVIIVLLAAALAVLLLASPSATPPAGPGGPELAKAEPQALAQPVEVRQVEPPVIARKSEEVTKSEVTKSEEVPKLEVPKIEEVTKSEVTKSEEVPKLEEPKKAAPKPKLLPRVYVVVLITNGPPVAEIEFGRMSVAYKSFAAVELRPDDYKVRWRASPEGPWHAVGSLTVDQLPADKAYDIRLTTTGMTVKTTRRGSAK